MDARLPSPATFFLALAISILSGPPIAAEVRDSDSLWFSTDGITGEPKLTSLDLDVGAIETLYLWLEVEPGQDFDVGAVYLPLFIDAPGETHLEVGSAGGSAWTGNSGAVPGTVLDPDLTAALPFSTWGVHAFYEKSYPTNGDSTHMLAAFAQSPPPDVGWNGAAPVASFTVTGTGVGSTTFDLTNHPLNGGGSAAPGISNPTGTNVWQPVMVPLTVNVVDLTDVGDAPKTLAFRLHPVSPSPLGERGTVRFDLPQPADVSLALFDGRGRILQSVLRSKPFSPGRHEQEIHMTELRPGTYFLRMTAESPDGGEILHQTSQKIVHVRSEAR